MIWDFPAGPVVKIPHSQWQDTWIQSLVGELRSHLLHSIAKISKFIKEFVE